MEVDMSALLWVCMAAAGPALLVAVEDGRRPAGAALWAVLMFQACRMRWQA